MAPPDTLPIFHLEDAPTDVHDIESGELSDTVSTTITSEPSARSRAPSDPTATSTKFLLPIPTPSSNKSQTSFALPEHGNESDADELPADIANADISIAADGSFVETTSGPAAWELKRRYDQQLGVGKDTRSPYAITAIVNQHGKQVFRVSMRDQSAAAAPVDELELHLNSSGSVSSGQQKRKSRMSINGLLAPSVFRNGATVTSPPHTADVTRSPPGAPRKLRKTRSIPDMTSGVAGPSSLDSSSRPQGGPTGRAHSHSVTGADMPHLPIKPVGNTSSAGGDVFSHVMGWGEPTSPISGRDSSIGSNAVSGDKASVDSYCDKCDKDAFEHPFGRGVVFDSPHRNSAIFMPLVIREMQSFESGLTARAESYFKSQDEKPEPPKKVDSRPSSPEQSKSTRPSALAFETNRHCRYATSVFDVMQTYRGLPMLNTLSADSKEPTIKMSLSALDGAAPRDDPRFVIWGEVDAVADDVSLLESHTDLSSSLSGVSRRRSTKGKHHSLLPELRLSSAEGSSRRILMAATIERWIAQLTSQFDYDELLIFFLTYRTYVNAVDLCHLLICRFHWALEEPASSHEVMVRQVVRVRTFVAIRYWLLTFFRVDFLPNRDLCLLFANWLNALHHDPILNKYPDARNIVRKLKKIAKDCRAAHTKRGKSTQPPKEKKPKPINPIDRILGDLSNSVNFAASLRKVSAPQDDVDSDVDLDFNPEESSPFPEVVGIQGFASFANQLGGGNKTGVEEDKSSVISSGTVASAIQLQQPLHMTILQHAKATPPGIDRPLVTTPATLPVHHSALSRAVVNTIGRLGRWKRVLSSRSPNTALAPCTDVSAFDLEMNDSGDLLTVRGGVEQYLKMIGPSSSGSATPSRALVGVDQDKPLPTPTEEPDTEATSVPDVDIRNSSDDETKAADEDYTDSIGHSDGAYSDEAPTYASSAPRPASEHSLLSSYEDFPRAVAARPTARSAGSWHPDIVSIDELDLSDCSSSDGEDEPHPALPPGLRQGPRRLPLRREFEFVRRSVDSVSSMGIISRPSVALSEQSDRSSSASSQQGFGGPLQHWQWNALIDDLSEDEDGPGDAEAALRRLEGQINPKQQQAKEAKVNGWVRTIQERMAMGDFRDDQPRNLSDDDEDDNSDEDYGTESRVRDLSTDNEDITVSLSNPSPRTSEDSGAVPIDLVVTPDARESGEALTPTPEKTTLWANGAPDPTSPSPSHPAEGKPKVDEAVPPEILESRLPSQPTVAGGRVPNSQNVPLQTYGHFATLNAPATHRSFILGYRSEVIAHHFAVIDREIFLGIQFEELVCEDWLSSSAELNVLDWDQFLRDRRRKVESRGKGKTSALAAARARFNLVANFTLSEIALSHPSERVLVVSKFIRVAWKAYLQNNFATLVAIVSGLCSEWVKKAMRRSWNRIGIWETRVFEDLKAFTTSDDNFRYIRQAIAAIIDAKPLNPTHDDSNASTGPTDGLSSASRTKSNPDGKPIPAACVPFLGVYLSQLYRFSKMPDLIDPSAPTEAVKQDAVSGAFSPTAHPEVFSTLQPLPSSMQLEPLINVQKQRLIAQVIKSLVAGQHLANKVELSMDKKLLSRCLRLRALDVDALQRILSLYSDY